MPTYDYRCTTCEQTFEIAHRMDDTRDGSKALDCPLVNDGTETECPGTLKRAYTSAPPMQLQGDGWTKGAGRPG